MKESDVGPRGDHSSISTVFKIYWEGGALSYDLPDTAGVLENQVLSILWSRGL